MGKNILNWAFPGGSVVRNLPANVGDTGSIPGSGRYPREGNGNPFQCSYRRAYWAIVPGVTKELDTIYRWKQQHTLTPKLFLSLKLQVVPESTFPSDMLHLVVSLTYILNHYSFFQTKYHYCVYFLSCILLSIALLLKNKYYFFYNMVH